MLQASDYGVIGAIEKRAEDVWKANRVDIYHDLVEIAGPRLSIAASHALKINPKGGRPNKHSAKLFRSKRPEREVLMPYGVETWPARAPQPY